MSHYPGWEIYQIFNREDLKYASKWQKGYWSVSIQGTEIMPVLLSVRNQYKEWLMQQREKKKKKTISQLKIAGNN